MGILEQIVSLRFFYCQYDFNIATFNKGFNLPFPKQQTLSPYLIQFVGYGVLIKVTPCEILDIKKSFSHTKTLNAAQKF